MPVNPCFLSQVTNRDFEKSLTPEERSAFWRYAKSIGADKGVDHATVVSQMAQKFNMPERLIAQALDGPKTVRRASEEVRARQKASAQFLASNKRHLAQMDKTGSARIINFLSDGVRRSLLAFHGPVIPAIHALDIAPTNPVKFLRSYGRAFASLSEKAHENIQANLEGRKYFKLFSDAGLPIGRNDIGREGFPKQGWASRSMDASMKPLRYELMEAKWEKIPESEQTPQMLKFLAEQYAHATMSLVRGEKLEVATRGLRKVLLAPMMTPAKIAKSIIDPIKTISTFERAVESKLNKNIRPPTPEERTVAYNRLRRAATYFGVTLGALAVNKALLESLGSKQKVNLDKPIQGDFLAFKFAGRSLRVRGTMEIVALLAKLGALGTQKYKYGQQTPEDAIAKYGEYKLTPGIGLGKELMTGKDIFGRPVPWSKEEGSAKFPRKNIMEFTGEHLPIFFGHAVSAFHEVLRDQGVDTRQSMNVIRSVMRNPELARKALEEASLTGVAEFFGVNIQPDRYMNKPESATNYSPHSIMQKHSNLKQPAYK